MQLLRATEVGKLLKIYTKQLYEPEFRKRWNLPAVRVGRSIRFREEDVQRIIDNGLEVFEESASDSERPIARESLQGMRGTAGGSLAKDAGI